MPFPDTSGDCKYSGLLQLLSSHWKNKRLCYCGPKWSLLLWAVLGAAPITSITITILAAMTCGRKQSATAVFRYVLWTHFHDSTADRGGPAGDKDLEENGNAKQWRKLPAAAPKPHWCHPLATSQLSSCSHGQGLSPLLSRWDFAPLIYIW